MAEHVVVARWVATPGEDFASGKYNRRHEWEFDSGQVLAASPSPSVVKAPYSDASCVDPEEAFIAAIASCHLLSFLYLAAKHGVVVIRYQDRAVGVLEKNEQRRSWVSRVTLNPQLEFDGAPPDAETLAHLHHAAHEECFIANSVKTQIVVAGL